MKPLAASVLALVVACSSEPTEPRQLVAPPDGDPTLTLYVSNQSFDIDPVDIRVTIDRVRMVEGEFLVEGQHNFHEFTFALAPGTHLIEATTRAGDAVFAETFDVAEQHWAALMFWYYPAEPEPTPRQFSWTYQDEPIYFQ